MIEQKLQQAADSLPAHRSDYPALEEHVRKTQYRSKPIRRKRLAIAMVLAVLLVGCVAVREPDYHLYNGNWAGFISGMDGTSELEGWAWKETQKAANKLEITLPETLGGYPVINFNRYNLTDRKVLIQFAWLNPRYVYQSGFYGKVWEEPWLSPDGTEGTRQRQEGAEVTFGPTDDEVWRRQFGFDENDTCVGSNYTTGRVDTEGITCMEHEGITIYAGKVLYDTLDLPHWVVTWVDYGHGAVFCVDGESEAPDSLIEYAKQIIDLNK